MYPSHESIDLTWPPATTKCVLSVNRPPSCSASFRCSRRLMLKYRREIDTVAKGLPSRTAFAAGDSRYERIGIHVRNHQVGDAISTRS